MRAGRALTRLYVSASQSEPSLIPYVNSTMILCTSHCNHVPPRAGDSRGGHGGAKVPWFYLRGVPVVLWICQAFDTHQNSGGNSGAFYWVLPGYSAMF